MLLCYGIIHLYIFLIFFFIILWKDALVVLWILELCTGLTDSLTDSLGLSFQRSFFSALSNVTILLTQIRLKLHLFGSWLLAKRLCLVPLYMYKLLVSMPLTSMSFTWSLVYKVCVIWIEDFLNLGLDLGPNSYICEYCYI